MEQQEKDTKGFNKLRQVAFKLIDSATLRAKNRRVSIALPIGIMIKLSPFDLNYISALLTSAQFSQDFNNITLSYVDDLNLSLKSAKVSVGVLKSIISFLSNLSLRIDLKATYRLSKLKDCKNTKDLMNMIHEINVEEETIETDYLEH